MSTERSARRGCNSSLHLKMGVSLKNTMNNLSYEGIGAIVATFNCKRELKVAHVVSMNGPKTMDKCHNGECFDGVVFDWEPKIVAVQVRGFAKVKTNESEWFSMGRNLLVADGEGGVRQAQTHESVAEVKAAREYLVVDNSEAGFISILL